MKKANFLIFGILITVAVLAVIGFLLYSALGPEIRLGERNAANPEVVYKPSHVKSPESKVSESGTKPINEWCVIDYGIDLTPNMGQDLKEGVQGVSGKFKGIVASGEFLGYCHIQYVTNINVEGQVVLAVTDLYLNEYKEGFSVESIRGQEISRTEIKN